jgi:hypothetical protein
MTAFSAAVAASDDARGGAQQAAARALESLGARPALAIVFASPSYADLDAVPSVVEAEVGPVAVIGGTAGGAVFDGRDVVKRGVLVALIGGDVRTATATAPIGSAELLDVVPAGGRLLAAADRAAQGGLQEALCFAFAPGLRVDGEALVAALRKGAGARMQLAGGLTGDDFTFDRPRVFADGGARDDRVVLAGVFTRHPAGIAARHGWRAVAPARAVTRSDGAWLLELDGRRALDAWLADVRAAGGALSADRSQLLVQLANGYELGVDVPSHVEPLVRAPMALRDDGAVMLSAAITEGTRVQVMHASAEQMLDASRWAADVARERVGGSSAGALVLACSGRLAALDGRFGEEPQAIARSLDAPVAGACVFGEIARAQREIDAFHNTTSVVVALPR